MLEQLEQLERPELELEHLEQPEPTELSRSRPELHMHADGLWLMLPVVFRTGFFLIFAGLRELLSLLSEFLSSIITGENN